MTESRRHEEFVRRKEVEFRALVERSPDTVARYDAAGRRTYANPALARAAGRPQEDLVGMFAGERLASTPGAAQRYRDSVRHVLQTGQDTVLELSWRTDHGEDVTSQIRLVAERGANGAVESVLAIGRDISSLMQTQRQLRALIGAHPDVVIRCDLAGRIRFISAESAARFGRAIESYPGKTVADLEPVHGAPVHRAVLEVARSGLPQVLELPYPMRGELRHWEVRLVPEVDEHGLVTGVLCSSRDITERQLAAEKIRELNLRREASREEERRHIAHEIHDEMGQVLSAVRMELSLVRMRWGGDSSELREKVHSMQSMIDHLMRVTRDLVTSLRPPALDLGIASALEWLADQFRAASGIPCRLNVDPACAELDSQQTIQVFRIVQESLTNVSRHANASAVDVILERLGASFLLIVRDDGCGFDTTARRLGSLGLVGLRERADLLGGQLDLRSGAGRGTAVNVSFPAPSGVDG